MEARIERAMMGGLTGKAKGLQRLLLKSFSARLSAVATVNPRLKSAEHARSNELVAIAERISPFRQSDEEVKLVAIDKPSGGWRPLTIFGLERAALQKLACWAVSPFHSADPRQFALTGGGHNEAARQVRRALVEGYTWFVGLDITSFYSSIEKGQLNDLIPLPNKVIEHVIGSTSMTSARIGRVGRALAGIRLVQASQSGISQGSRSSPLIAEVIVKDILRQFPLDARIINVADDFGILTRSKRDAVAIQLALIRATARCPAGCFQLRSKVHPGPRRACDGFEFLGYRFSRRRLKVRCDVSSANVEKFNARIIDYADQMADGIPNAISKLRKYVKSWWRSFPLVEPYLRDLNFVAGRYHVGRIVRHHRRHLLPLFNIAMAWEGHNYAPLPPDAQLSQFVRAIRRANPVNRSNVPHW